MTLPDRLARLSRTRLAAVLGIGAAGLFLLALALGGRPSPPPGASPSSVTIAPSGSSGTPSPSRSGSSDPSAAASSSPNPGGSSAAVPTDRPTTEPTPVPGPSDEAALPLELVESGLSAFGSGGQDLAAFGALIRNPNPAGWQATRALVHADLFGPDDAHLGTVDTYLTIEPGRTVAIAGELFGGGDAIRLDVVLPEDIDAFTNVAGPAPDLDVVGVRTTRPDGTNVTTGELVNRGPTTRTFVELVAIHRDGAGRIIGGASGAVESIPAGGRVAFEILDSVPYPAIASTEVLWRTGG